MRVGMKVNKLAVQLADKLVAVSVLRTVETKVANSVVLTVG